MHGFEEALPAVKRAAVADKRKRLAREKLESVAALLSGGRTLNEAAEGASLEVQEATAVGRYDAIPGVGREPSVIGTAFALSPGQTSQVVEGNTGFFVVRLTRHVPLDEELYVAQKDQMKLQLLQQKRMIAISLWLEQLRDAARIEDYRAEVLGF